MENKIVKVKEWIKTRSWKRNVAFLIVFIPIMLQKFGVDQEAIGWLNQVIKILTGGITDDGTIATTISGALFYWYGWAARNKKKAQ